MEQLKKISTFKTLLPKIIMIVFLVIATPFIYKAISFGLDPQIEDKEPVIKKVVESLGIILWGLIFSYMVKYIIKNTFTSKSRHF